MIRNQWYVVLESTEVKNTPIGTTRMGEKLVFWRNEAGELSCLRDQCAHRGVQLSLGKIVHNHLQCPFHGFEYDKTGKVTAIPANGRTTPVAKQYRVSGYPTHEAHGFIWIWWGDDPPTDLATPRYFDDIDESFGWWATVKDPWKAHYSRVLENQIDCVHVPFVHYDTIGRGGKTIVDGPGFEWVNEDQFNMYVYFRAEDGGTAKKPDQVPVPNPDKDYKMSVIMPNLWENYITKDYRLVGAFVPVDEENTLLYLRNYQKFVKVPFLREFICWANVPLMLHIAHQDRRIVNTHQPKISGLRIGEKLIPGDKPIIEYRKRRQALQDKVKKMAAKQK